MRNRKDSDEHPCRGSICKTSKRPALLRLPYKFCSRCSAAEITVRLAEIGYEATYGGKYRGLRKDLMRGLLAVAGR